MLMMKCTLVFILFNLLTLFSNGQVIYFDDFESYDSEVRLTDFGYSLNHHQSYLYPVECIVQKDNGNSFAKCFSSINGQAGMEFSRTIKLEPGNMYLFSLKSKGLYKRRLCAYVNEQMVASGEDYKPEDSGELKWVNHELMVVATDSINEITFGIFHNWSGSLFVDDFKITRVEQESLDAYYISTSEGNDQNKGTNDSPWKTIDKLNTVYLRPGNRVCFKRGDRFDGHITPIGSGTFDQPIVLTAYGIGDLPILTGEFGELDGGDYQEAILIKNQSHYTFEDIEIHNERLVDRIGVDETDAFGIHIMNTSDRVIQGFIFKNVTFRNIYAPKPILQDDGEDTFNNLEVAGLRFFSNKNDVVGLEKNIQDVLVENCFFENIQRLGIHIKHGGGAPGVGDDFMNRNANLIFRNNTFRNLGGSCILPTRTYNCLIEDNLFDHPGSNADSRMAQRGSAVWTWKCMNTVIQRNQCISARGYLDSHGIHIDHENKNTFVQYNLMQDCEGGFVEILGGNVNAVYRFNISVNDGWRENPNWENSNHTLWISKNTASGTQLCDSSYIYNNTIIIDQLYSTSINIEATNTHIYNNIFYAVNSAEIGNKQMVVKDDHIFISNNLFCGNVSQAFSAKDANPIFGDPLFCANSNDKKSDYKISKESMAFGTGVNRYCPPIPQAGKGIFVDVSAYPIVDFFGNPINYENGDISIGACNSGIQTSKNSQHQKQFRLFPNPCVNILMIDGVDVESDLSVLNLKGEIIYQQSFSSRVNVSGFSNGVYVLKIDGYPTQLFIKCAE